MPSHTVPPSADDIAEMAEMALSAMPAPLRQRARGVSILVEDAADDATLAELGLESPWELTGLYRGIPFGQAAAVDVRHEPDMIVLYREAILLEWIEAGEDLFRLVRNVLVHEVAHHFGIDEDTLHRLGWA